MKIMKLSRFMTTPPGTVFMSYTPHYFGPLYIKRGNVGERDFFYSELSTNVETPPYTEIDEDVSLFIDMESESRDGLFDTDSLYAVLEKYEVSNLIEVLTDCMRMI
jgi:hypothetical protein